jgi:hypothetical protein
VFHPSAVAEDIVRYSAMGYFGISTGLDGWMLKQLHPGMSPINNWWEYLQGVLFAPLCRIVSMFYLLEWDRECRRAHEAESEAKRRLEDSPPGSRYATRRNSRTKKSN